jgi:thiol-disulfide isomerase/thioredoxin
MLNLTEDTVKDFIKQAGTVCLKVWSDGCGWCDKQAPVLDKVSADFPDVKFGAININYSGKDPSAFRDEFMEGIPTAPVLFIFKDGVMAGRAYKALLSEPILKKFITEPTVEIKKKPATTPEEHLKSASVEQLKAHLWDLENEHKMFMAELGRRK